VTRVEILAKLCGVPLTDYERDAEGVLVASGSGLMMSVMDHAPSIRWCVEYDERVCRGARWVEFIPALCEVAPIVVVAGWFTVTDPTELRAAVAACPSSCAPITYGGNTTLGGIEAATLAQLFDMIGQAGR